MRAVGKKLQSIYDGTEPATVGLERLVQNSSTLAKALAICKAVDAGPQREMVAQVFLNCYCAGFVAGVDFTKERAMTIFEP